MPNTHLIRLLAVFLLLSLAHGLQAQLSPSNSVAADSCFVLRPDAKAGKDAYIETRRPDLNFAQHIDFTAIAWTNGGVPVDARGLLGFKLGSIPDGSVVQSAALSLYSYRSPANGTHSNRSGSNRSILRRITSFWQEANVTWNTQPTTTEEGQIYLEASSDDIQDYLNIDVTDMVREMRLSPEDSQGFMFRLETEDFYRNMLFASSDNPDSLLHPKLEVCYSLISSTSGPLAAEAVFVLSPNPAKDWVKIELFDFQADDVVIDVFSNNGQQLLRSQNVAINDTIDVSALPAGLYFVRLSANGLSYTQKLIVE